MQNEHKAPTLPRACTILKLCCREWVPLTSHPVKGCTHARLPQQDTSRAPSPFYLGFTFWVSSWARFNPNVKPNILTLFDNFIRVYNVFPVAFITPCPL